MNLLTLGKTEAISAVIRAVTGDDPIIEDHGSYQKIAFTPSQQIKIRAYIERQLDKKPAPSDIRIDTDPIVLPIAIKKIAPFLIAALAVGFFVGRKL